MNLQLILETLNASVDNDKRNLQYYVKPIPKYEVHYFGYTNSGFPCMLLYSTTNSLTPPLRLAAIEICFSVQCSTFVAGDVLRNTTLTTITCTSTDSIVQRYFVHVCETIIRIVGASPNFSRVSRAIEQLVDIFQRLTVPAKRSVVGLIGELYVIHAARSTTTAVKAWRNAPNDRFDFSLDNIRLEVKASSNRQRVHMFSLEQCTPPPTTHGILISLFIETSGRGTSLLDLVKRIERQIDGDTELLLKLQDTIAKGLGKTVSTALTTRFDENLAKSSLRVFDLESVPAVRGNVPIEVTRVRFQSDISNASLAVSQTQIWESRNLRNLLPKFDVPK